MCSEHGDILQKIACIEECLKGDENVKNVSHRTLKQTKSGLSLVSRIVGMLSDDLLIV